jgi:hypothetical protein
MQRLKKTNWAAHNKSDGPAIIGGNEVTQLPLAVDEIRQDVIRRVPVGRDFLDLALQAYAARGHTSLGKMFVAPAWCP